MNAKATETKGIVKTTEGQLRINALSFNERGVCLIKKGNKILAEAHDLRIFFENTPSLLAGVNEKEPYSLTLRNPGRGRKCESVEQMIHFINKHIFYMDDVLFCTVK